MIINENTLRRSVRKELRAILYEKILSSLHEKSEEKEVDSKAEKTLDKDEIDDIFTKELSNASGELKSLVKKVEDQVAESFKNRKGKKLNESIAATIIGTLMAVPAFLELLGFLSKMMAKIARKLGLDNVAFTAAGAGIALQEAGHWLQKKFYKIITLLLSPIYRAAGIKEPKTKEKVSKAVFIVVCACLVVHSGIELKNAIKNGFDFLHGYEGALTSIKSGEVGKGILQALKVILSAEGAQTAGAAAVAALKRS